MRNVFLISLMITYMFGCTELGEILKVPQLFNHFLQHRRINPELTFFQFLEEHYQGDDRTDGTDADDHEDQKLPYHNTHAQNLFPAFALVMIPADSESVETDFSQQEYSEWLPESIPAAHTIKLLRPPRNA